MYRTFLSMMYIGAGATVHIRICTVKPIKGLLSNAPMYLALLHMKSLVCVHLNPPK